MYVKIEINFFYHSNSFFFAKNVIAQIGTTIPSNRTTDWSTAGVDWSVIEYQIGYPSSSFDFVIEATNHLILTCGSIDPTGVNDNTTSVQCLIDEAETAAISSGNPNFLTLIYFEPGTYKFEGGLKIDYGHVVIRGANPSYTFFNFTDSTTSLFNIGNDQSNGSQQTILAKNSSDPSITLTSTPIGVGLGDYIELRKNMNEVDLCTVPGAHHPECETNQLEYGQVVRVVNVIGNTIYLADPFAIDYFVETPGTEFDFRMQKIVVTEMVGIEDIKINSMSGAILDGGHNVFLGYSVNCWVSGVEGNNTGYTHVSISHCSDITVSGNNFHHAINYTEGPGYGVWIGNKTTNSLIENNIITNMRHSIVLSTSMPCRNVIGYNYTAEPMAPGVVDEIDLHGYFPGLNLFEGNFTGNLTFDTYWGYNGIYNTIFRNYILQYDRNYTLRTNSFGNIYLNHNFVGDDGLLLEGNNCLTNTCSGNFVDKSYYNSTKPSFISACYTWPLIGPPTSGSVQLSNTNPARTRYLSGGQFTINPKDEFTGYSIENTALISGFNAITEEPAVIYRNQNDLSTGGYGNCEPFYYNATGYWDVGPMTTAIIAITGVEEIITSYNNTDGGAAIYRSSGKGNPPILLWSQANTEVTAMTSGNFIGDSRDEIVLAIVENGYPYLYVSSNLSNLEEGIIVDYNPSRNGDVISALAAGNFIPADVYEELYIGYNTDGNISRIYVKNNVYHPISGIPIFGLTTHVWQNTNGYWNIDALAAGDFDQNGDPELIEGFNSADGPAIYRSETGNSMVSLIYSGSSYWTIAALAAGDLDNNGDDELITGFNSEFEGPNIYKSEDGLSAGEVRIYDKKAIYWTLSSLAIEKNQNRPKRLEDEYLGEDALSNNSIFVFPNPTDGIFTVQLTSEFYESSVYQVYNLQGQLILNGEFISRIESMDLSQFEKGVYILRVLDGETIFVEQIIIQ